MLIIYIIPWVLSVAFSQNTVDVIYLRGVARLNDSSFMDYYFSCNTVGPSLDWQVNGNILGFPGSQTIGSFRFVVGTDFVSYATLLSTSAIGTGTFSYDSILVVSSVMSGVDVSPNVRCFSGTGTIKTADTTAGASSNPILTMSSDTVLLQYLFSTNIVNETSTHMYVCGVSATTLAWSVSGSTETLAFDSTQNVGANLKVLSDSNTFTALNAILISLQPYPLSSVFYVTGPGILDVRCGTGQATEMITAQEVRELPTTTPAMRTTTPEIALVTSAGSTATTTDGGGGDGGGGSTPSSSRCGQTCVTVISAIIVAVVVAIPVALLLWLHVRVEENGKLEDAKVLDNADSKSELQYCSEASIPFFKKT